MVIQTARRTQADRTAATKGALADAAIEVLVEKGWAATTVVEVCERVGVSRGAFHHHYDSLPELLADALRRLYAESVKELPPEIGDVASLVDVTWRAIGSPRFKAVIEAWLAMANDPALRSGIGPVVAEFASLVNPDGITTILDTAEKRNFFVMARESMLGLALGRATNRGRALGHERRVLAFLRAQATALSDH
jgi:AcrR family transcriptional regulator